MSTVHRATPWKLVARPHADVTGGALDMGTYAANLARVFRESPDVPEVYRRPDRFFDATYFTDGIRSLLREVMGVLIGGPGNRVLQLRTPFGGGKTHSLVALLHLCRARPAAAGVPELGGLPDPGPVQVAVLSGEELDPLRSIRSVGGIETHTLWGELGAQLGRYELLAEHDRERSAPGGETLRQVLGDGPVLLLMDEVLVYVEKAMAVPRGESTLGRQALLFMQALTEVANNRPQTAMVYSLQASVGEAAGSEGLLTQLEHLVSRVDAKREPVSGDEVMRVVQRRLFTELGAEAVHREVAAAYADLVRRQVVAQAETADARREAEAEARRMEERVLAAYPFHPALLDLMHHRWGSLPSYQRTRGALQFLACVVSDLWLRGDDSALIGPGEVNLADEQVRGAFFSQVGERERYSSVLDGDIVSDGSGAAAVDRRIGLDSPALAQLRAGTRAATAIMLYSFGSPEGEERGVLEGDLVPATLVPGLDRNVIVAALHDLREEELFLHYSGRRYRFEPTPNLTKLVRDEAQKFTADEVLKAVRDELEHQLQGAPHAAVWPEGPEKMRDRVPAFQVAYLHPDWDEARQPLRSFVELAQGGKRAYRNGIGFALPDRSQFDRARAAGRLQRAADSLISRRAAPGLRTEQIEELKEKRDGAQRDLQGTIQHAYSRAVVPVRRSDDEVASGDAYELHDADLRTLLTAGRGLHDRVLEALSDKVFVTVTVDKLISLSGLGTDRAFVRCVDLVDWFYSFFEFTKLTDRAGIAGAIATGVTEKRLAYTVGAELLDNKLRVRNPELIRADGLVASTEIDLSEGAAILTQDLAAQLLPSVRPGSEPESEQGSNRQPLGPQHPVVKPIGPTESLAQLALRFRMDQQGLFELSRALSWLRDQSAYLDIEITLRAGAKGDGYDRIRLRNGVFEPLQEGGAQFIGDRPE